MRACPVLAKLGTWPRRPGAWPGYLGARHHGISSNTRSKPSCKRWSQQATWQSSNHTLPHALKLERDVSLQGSHAGLRKKAKPSAQQSLQDALGPHLKSQHSVRVLGSCSGCRTPLAAPENQRSMVSFEENLWPACDGRSRTARAKRRGAQRRRPDAVAASLLWVLLKPCSPIHSLCCAWVA